MKCFIGSGDKNGRLETKFTCEHYILDIYLNLELHQFLRDAFTYQCIDIWCHLKYLGYPRQTHRPDKYDVGPKGDL